ncbi:SPX-domain-containing protein [Pholiota conissans]|uniref:SPX-domain-containing protein n=1 Tax=Pholiota conissans TaxID=109636 RepID=A0A9P5Z7B0_9AGAR|nr:SPX-domain-containing protein [Pholiota conissans]
MKFAQYLRDTQTPEWKKAYIDYRGLKKRITAIRKAQHGLSFHVSSDSPDDLPSPPDAPQPSDVDSEEFERSVDLALERVTSGGKESGRGDAPSASGNPKSIASGGRRSIGMSSFKPTRGKSFSSMISNAASTGSPRLDGHPFAALPLHELLTQLSPHEVSFFTLLDAQLDKVESFYLAREKEMLARGRTLQLQLDELSDHRKLFLEAHTQEPWSVAILATIRNMVGLYPPLKIPKKWHIINKTDTKISAESNLLQAKSNDAVVEAAQSTSTSALRFLPTMRSIGKRKDSEQMNLGDNTHEDEVLGDDDDPRVTNLSMSADPDSYLYAKRRLKKAVIEHYRGLEMLHNYRVLNITGFRKALKKFEKVTKIPVQHQYMTEKVDKSAFASDKAVHHMMTQMEDMYAKAFVRGDKKKALKRLRGGGISKNHHFSTFRSGVLLGLAIPALVNGIVNISITHTGGNSAVGCLAVHLWLDPSTRALHPFGRAESGCVG